MSTHFDNKKENTRNNLQTVKKQLKLTLKTIGSKTGVTDATVSRYLSGVMEITDAWLERFCAVFHVDGTWIVQGSGEPVFTDYTSAADCKDASGAGQRLVQMRKELGIDQKQVFELLGITRAMYSRIENGHARLTIENAQIIEDLLGIGIEWLLYGDEEKKVAPVGQRMEQWLWKHKDVLPGCTPAKKQREGCVTLYIVENVFNTSYILRFLPHRHCA